MRHLISDGEILNSVKIVSPEEAASNKAELVMLKASIRVAAMSGKTLRVIKWPNGIAALVDCDPVDTEHWEQLLLKSYRGAIRGNPGQYSVEV